MTPISFGPLRPWQVVMLLLTVTAAVSLLWTGKRPPPRTVESLPGSSTESKSPQWAAPSVAGWKQDLPAEAKRARVEGLVVGPDELPVAAATVVLRGETSVLTEKNGTFVIDGLVPGSYELVARKGALIGDPVEVQATSGRTPAVVLVLHQGAGVQLRVVARESGRPLAGATLKAEALDGVVAETDEDGLAMLEGVPSGPRGVTVSARGFATVRVTVAHDSRQAVPTRVQVALEAARRASGQVLDVQRKPIPDATVCALRDDAAVLSGAQPGDCVTTDDSGRWALGQLPAGSFRFEGTHPMYAPGVSTPVRLDEGADTAEVVIVLTDGARLGGRVLDQEGAGRAALTVEVQNAGAGYGAVGRRSAKTDAAGSFEFKGLPRTSVLVLAHGADSASSEVEVDLSSGNAEVTLRLTVNGRIAGEVVDAQGQRVAGAQVVAIPQDGAEVAAMARSRSGRLAIGLSDDQGLFQVGPLAPGAYQLRAATELSVQDVGFWHQQAVMAHVGDTNVRLVVLPTASLHGRVALEKGGVPSAYSVALTLSKPQVFSARDGSFRIGHVVPGKHLVKVAAPGQAETELAVDALKPGEDRDLGTIVLRGGQSLSGHVLDTAGQPVGGARVLLGAELLGDGRAPGAGTYETQTNERGAFTFEGLGSDVLTIVAEHAEKGRSRPKTVAAGATDVELQLGPMTSLSGIVKVQGKPMARATVVVTPKGVSTGRLMVTTQADGRYLFQNLTEGDYLVAAALQQSPTLQFFQSVAVQVGHEPMVVDLEIVPGPKTVRLQVLEADGRACNRGLAYLTTAPLVTSRLAELEAGLASAGPARVWLQVMTGGATSPLSGLGAPTMTACVVPVDEDHSDPTAHQHLREHAASLMAYCQPVDLAAVPDGEVLLVRLPARN